LVVNNLINCLTYEIEGNIKQCKFRNQSGAQLEPPDSTGHVLEEIIYHDFMLTVNYESEFTYYEEVRRVDRICDKTVRCGDKKNITMIKVLKRWDGNTA
jgi:hypothetical protein